MERAFTFGRCRRESRVLLEHVPTLEPDRLEMLNDARNVDGSRAERGEQPIDHRLAKRAQPGHHFVAHHRIHVLEMHMYGAFAGGFDDLDRVHPSQVDVPGIDTDSDFEQSRSRYTSCARSTAIP